MLPRGSTACIPLAACRPYRSRLPRLSALLLALHLYFCPCHATLDSNLCRLVTLNSTHLPKEGGRRRSLGRGGERASSAQMSTAERSRADALELRIAALALFKTAGENTGSRSMRRPLQLRL